MPEQVGDGQQKTICVEILAGQRQHLKGYQGHGYLSYCNTRIRKRNTGITMNKGT